MQPGTSGGTKGLFAALYDFSFTSLITTKVIRFVYGLLVVVYSLAAAGLLIALISQGGAAIAVALIGIPIAYFLYLIALRIMMEFIIIIFRIGEDIRSMRIGGDRLGNPASPSGHDSGPYRDPMAPTYSPPPALPPGPAPTNEQRRAIEGGQLSPDGNFKWDGNNWRPVQR